jgi:hypothetical protein
MKTSFDIGLVEIESCIVLKNKNHDFYPSSIATKLIIESNLIIICLD